MDFLSNPKLFAGRIISRDLFFFFSSLRGGIVWNDGFSPNGLPHWAPIPLPPSWQKGRMNVFFYFRPALFFFLTPLPGALPSPPSLQDKAQLFRPNNSSVFYFMPCVTKAVFCGPPILFGLFSPPPSMLFRDSVRLLSFLSSGTE